MKKAFFILSRHPIPVLAGLALLLAGLLIWAFQPSDSPASSANGTSAEGTSAEGSPVTTVESLSAKPVLGRKTESLAPGVAVSGEAMPLSRFPKSVVSESDLDLGAAPVSEVVAIDHTQTRAENLLVALETLVADNPNGNHDEEINKLQQELADLAQTDQRVLDHLCIVYYENPASQPSQFIRQVLGTIQDPAVEGLGLALVSEGKRDLVVAGLDLLGELGIPNRNTFVPILELMEVEEIDADVLTKSMQAIRPMPLPRSETERLMARLGELTQHENLGVRIDSLFATARWAKSGASISPVVDALASDNQQERISAAMALKESSVVSDAMGEKLLGIMDDPEEEWFLRRMAFDSLQRFDLSNEDFMAVDKFRDTVDDILEGGDVPGRETTSDLDAVPPHNGQG